MNGSNKDINLYDCFEYNQRIELKNGENQKYCNLYNNFYDSYYSRTLYNLPEILIIILNRGKNEVYQCNVNFPKELDLTNYVINKGFKTKYKLYAVICHIGPSYMSGHFAAYCCNRMDGQWYLYNDSEVTLCENSNEYLNKMPYFLFYQSKNIKNNIQNNIKLKKEEKEEKVEKEEKKDIEFKKEKEGKKYIEFEKEKEEKDEIEREKKGEKDELEDIEYIKEEEKERYEKERLENQEKEKLKENERLEKERKNKTEVNNEDINELKKQNLNLRNEIEQLKVK